MKTRLVNHFSLHHSDYKNMEEEESENESRYWFNAFFIHS